MTETKIDDGSAASWPEPLGSLEVALVFGLPIFIAIAAVATWWSVGRVEDRVATELRADLAAVGIDPDDVTIDVAYRDGTVEGILPSEIDPGVVDGALDGRLLRHVDVQSLVAAPPPLVPPNGAGVGEVSTGPVVIDVVYDGMTLLVTGTVLNEGQHNVVLETLDLLTGRAEIEERLMISRLAPEVAGVDDRIADLVTAMDSMDLADKWSLRLTDRGLTIEAVVTDPEAAAAVGALDGLLRATPTTIELTAPETADPT